MSKPLVIYCLLGLGWIGIVSWQVAEHRRVSQGLNETQLNRAHDIATSLAVVIRSQRRFGTVPRSRLVGALEELARSRELLGIAMLNPAGEIIASGGQIIDGDPADFSPGMVIHSNGRMIVASLVELGAERPPSRGPGAENGVPDAGDQERPSTAIIWSFEEGEPMSDSPPQRRDGAESIEMTHEEERSQRRARWERMREMHPHFQPPERYREIYEKQGLHMLLLMMDDQQTEAVIERDALFRVVLGAVALLAVVGLALAWRAMSRSSELQIRLARSRALNSYLRELNLAAAGLAHETRNPLNIVRSVAQLTANDEQVPAEPRKRLHQAIEEVDRITARLNEFIDYSKPREPHLAAVSPVSVVNDVARTLEPDFMDKNITFTCAESPVEILADGTMLRQVLFNLLLNATQAVPEGGHVELRLLTNGSTAELELVDDGPGVPRDACEDIFRPYFTLSDCGSGLGLAIVRQIVLAHGWDIFCEPNPQGGCIFRIRGIEMAGKGSA